MLLCLMEIGSRGETRGSVLPGINFIMRFCFKLGLVLVTPDCGIAAECGVAKSVNISAVHVCAFCETKSVCKNAKCDAYTLFCGTNSHNQCCHCWDFSLDLEFSCFIWGSGFLLKIWGFFDSGQILEMYVVLLYFPFKNTVVS